MIRDTSLLAFYNVLTNLAERQMQVYKAIFKLGECSNTMISQKLGIPINCITGRVNELRKKGAVRLSKKDMCPLTNQLVCFWKAKKI